MARIAAFLPDARRFLYTAASTSKPDGSRFLVNTSANPQVSGSIGILLNWQAKLG